VSTGRFARISSIFSRTVAGEPITPVATLRRSFEVTERNVLPAAA
jgi:hypothetical protein